MEVFILNNSMQKQLLQMLNNIDKNDLENGLKKISDSLNDEQKKNILKAFNNLNKEN